MHNTAAAAAVDCCNDKQKLRLKLTETSTCARMPAAQLEQQLFRRLSPEAPCLLYADDNKLYSMPEPPSSDPALGRLTHESDRSAVAALATVVLQSA